MAILEILEFPDVRLRTQARRVGSVDQRIRKLVDDMFETMYAAPGIGLAASQVNIHEQVIVIDTSENKNEPLVFINPVLELSGLVIESDEGCLSVPGFYEPVKRREFVRVSALDRNGRPFSLDASGLLSVCIQHERDHLLGKLFVDYLSGLKRTLIRKKLEKLHRQTT
jgi:peptide deformylase